MIRANQDVFGEQCIMNDDGLLTASDRNKKIVQKFFRILWNWIRIVIIG